MSNWLAVAFGCISLGGALALCWLARYLSSNTALRRQGRR